MDEEQAREIAFKLMVVHLPASWLEIPANRLVDMKTSPKALRLRDAIAYHLRAAYQSGKSSREGAAPHS